MPDVVAESAVSVFILINVIPFYYTNYAQPKPYMDEIFHVPQAQKFCEGNYSYWDPMITTLPGLYLSSVAILKPMSFLPGTENICSTQRLRAVNLLFMTGNMVVLYLLIKKIHSKNKIISSYLMVFNAWTLSFFPVLYFFSWMYYTDPGAVLFTLLMYYCSLCDQHFLAATSGIVAILFRQTNIVWVIFVMGLGKGRELIKWMEQEKKDVNRMSDFKTLFIFITLFFKSLRHKPSLVFSLFVSVFKVMFWYLFVICGFMAFVYWNGSIVVGDKSHHEACANFPQIFYFLFVTLGFSLMHLASPSKLKYFFRFTIQSPVWVTFFVLLAYYVISHYTYVHEYLLADNRHYPFYVWSKIYRYHEYVKYSLIVVYLYSAISVARLLETKDIFWKICFIVCLCVSTIPQMLLEFRYFIIPYLLFRVNITVTSKVKLFLELLLYLGVNVLTVYIYINKTFRWTNLDSTQRFMW